MSDFMKRLGWTTSLALGAALIGAGCDNRGDDPVIDTVEPSPPGVPSTDYGDMDTMPGDPMPGGAMTGPDVGADFPAIEPAPGIAPDDGFEAPAPGADPGLPAEPEIQDEPAELGIDEQP